MTDSDVLTGDVISWIAHELNASDLDDDAGLVVLGALESDAELDASLSDGYQPPDREVSAGPEGVSGEVFLRTIQVEAFRGIGPQTRIDFQPGPGLTIVAGRNGSGKSSLAEACELALTGATYRWENRSEQWSGQWRNLHHVVAPSIRVGLVEQGQGPLDITANWPDDATEVGTAAFAHQRQGEKKVAGTADLGWAAPLAQFRPMLSYDELGGLLNGRPSDLYDAIANVLGVEQIGDALKRIQARVKEPKKVASDLTKRRKELATAAKSLDDDRAVEVAKLLRAAEPDVATLRGIVAGTTDLGTVVARLRALEAIPTDWDELAEPVVAQLRQAVAALADAGGGFGEARLQALGLRRGARHFHEQFGDQVCPVCGVGQLDSGWAEQSREAAAAEEAALAAVTTARQNMIAALDHANQYRGRVIPSLEPTEIDTLDTALVEAQEAVERWRAVPEASADNAASLLALAEHFERTTPQVGTACASLAEVVRHELESRQQTWEPLAVAVAAWCGAWEEHQPVRGQLAKLLRAEKWLKENDLRLKNERIAPLRDHARRAWSLLRQESNVEIANLELEGASTRRRIKIDTTVDGAEGGSLAVLSQGEMHALALALFLPRATMAESPFRFVVLDDPVQAMDPAKVDGLVDLLSELAQTRQVIVFSHDDRLPAAARRAELPARIIEVVRGTDSAVTIRSAVDPVSRYLGDARALTKDPKVPSETLRRTLPGLLRFAVEAMAREKFFRRRLGAGDPIATLEERWGDAQLTSARISLALYDQKQDIGSWLDQDGRRKFALGVVSGGMHNGLKSGIDPQDAVEAVGVLVRAIRDKA